MKTLFIGLLGIMALLTIGFLVSNNRKNIPWRTVVAGLIFQLLIAYSVLHIPFVQTFFREIGAVFIQILNFTKKGSEFLLGELVDTSTYGFIFLFQVIPTIIFFSAFTSLLFYLGIVQKVVGVLAWVFTKALKISGAESLSLAGNIFLGQTESPLLIKEYLPKMNNSEIMMVMTGGMATLSGSMLAAYIALLGGDDPQLRLEFAKHLLTASIMAAPGAIVFAKMVVPPSEMGASEVRVTSDRIGSNVLDAIAKGTSQGVRLAANIAAMLLTFIAFIAMFNYLAAKTGDWFGLNEMIYEITNGRYHELSLQLILGYIFSPFMWLIGVDGQDVTLVGRMLGEKLIMTEFIAYISLADLRESGAFYESRSVIMATYMLCGFANIASIGVQIGGIGSLAPNKSKVLAKYGVPALIAATLASVMSATLVGLILN